MLVVVLQLASASSARHQVDNSPRDAALRGAERSTNKQMARDVALTDARKGMSLQQPDGQLVNAHARRYRSISMPACIAAV